MAVNLHLQKENAMPKQKITPSQVEKEFHTGNRKRRQLKGETQKFMEANKGHLVIVADPKTDVIACSYGEIFTAVNFRSQETGKKSQVVAGLIRDIQSQGVKVDKSIDQFLLAIDGMLYNIGIKIRESRDASRKTLKALGK